MTVFIHQHCFRSFIYTLAAVLIIVIGLVPISAAQTTAASSAGKVDAAQDTTLPEVVVSGTKEKKVVPKEGSAESGYRSTSATVGPLGQMLLQDTPYSISVTPSALIEDIQASNPTDALKLNPTVNPEMGSNRTGDYLSIRGFINSDNEALDGMRQDMSSGTYLENKERIEILSGADSFLYGIATPAGMVNYILKRPTPKRMSKVTFGDYGGEQAYIHIDAGGPLDMKEKFGYRVNLLGVDNGSTGIDKETNRRMMYSGAFDWHITPKTMLAFDATNYHRSLEHFQSFFKLGKATIVPKAPDASRNYAAPYAGFENTNATYGTNLTTTINRTFTLRAAFRYSKGLADDRSLREVWTDNSGDYTEEMMYYPGQNKDETFQGNAFVDGVFQTGFAAHKLSVGYVVDHVPDSSMSSKGSQFYEGATIFNISNPGYEPFPNVTITRSGPYISMESRTRQSVIIADQLTLSHNWYALAGVAYAKIKDENFPASTGGKATIYDKGSFTPSVAVMYKPISSVTAYVSYIEALAEGPTAPSSAKNANQILPPYVSNQIEAGVKSLIHKMSLNAAFFRISQANAYTDATSEIYSEDGREVHTGVEATCTGKLTHNFTLLGGFSFLDPSITKTSTASLSGKSPQAVPSSMARLYGDYALPGIKGLFLTGGIYYTGKEWVNNTNTVSIPRILPGDLGLRYQRKVSGREVTFRANANNITNENYWTTKGGSMLYLGSPRIVATSKSVQI